MNAEQRKKLKKAALGWMQDPEAVDLLRSLFADSSSLTFAQKTDSKDFRGHTLIYYLVRTLGFSSFALGAAGLLADISFGLWATLIVVGLVVLSVDPWIEPSFQGLPKFWRSIPTVLYGAMLLAFVRFVVFAPGDLIVTARDYNADYPAEYEIADIKWNQKYSDLRVVFTNPNDYDYTDLDFVIGSGLYVVAAQQSTNLSGVSVYNTSAGPDRVTGSRKNESGQIEYEPDRNMEFLSGGIRVLCDRLPRHTSFEVVMAVVTVPSAGILSTPPDSDHLLVLQGEGVQNNPVSFGPRTPASRVGLSGWFKSFAHRRRRLRGEYDVKQM